jgi:hypothetical protein
MEYSSSGKSRRKKNDRGEVVEEKYRRCSPSLPSMASANFISAGALIGGVLLLVSSLTTPVSHLVWWLRVVVSDHGQTVIVGMLGACVKSAAGGNWQCINDQLGMRFDGAVDIPEVDTIRKSFVAANPFAYFLVLHPIGKPKEKRRNGEV